MGNSCCPNEPDPNLKAKPSKYTSQLPQPGPTNSAEAIVYEAPKPSKHKPPPKAYQQPRFTIITEMVSEEDATTQHQPRESLANPDFDSFVNPEEQRKTAGTLSRPLMRMSGDDS